MDKLMAKSALYTDYQPGIHGANSENAVLLQEVKGLGMLNLVVWDEGAVNTILQKTINLSLPQVGQSSVNAQFAVLWTAPHRYLITSIESTVMKSISNQLATEHGALQNLSSARSVIRIQGLNCRNVMAKGINLPLDDVSFVNGQVVASNFDHHYPAIIHNLSDPEIDIFDIYITRSFALSFWQWLCDSSLEYGYEVLESTSNG